MKGRKKPKNFGKYLFRYEYFIGLIIALFCVLAFSLISSIPTKAAIDERITATQSRSVSELLENPVNAPYKIVAMAATALSPSVRMVRAVSFGFFILANVAMYYALKHWHTVRASLLTTIAFATNAVVLATARLGTPLITAMSFYIFAALLLWQLHTKSNKTVPVIVLAALAALLYTPGVVWFLIVMAAVYWKSIKNLFKNVKRQAALTGILLALVIMFPLLLSFAKDVSLMREWLLLPENLDWSSVPRSIVRVPSAYIYRMPEEPLINVARLPIFDLASGIIFLIGLNAYRQKVRLDRTKVMIGSAFMAILIGAIGQLLLAVVMLLPFAFSVIAAGIEYLLDQWNAVFPRNPLARSFGFLLVTCVVLFGTYYQLSRFLVVWPQTPETRQAYNQSRILAD